MDFHGWPECSCHAAILALRQLNRLLNSTRWDVLARHDMMDVDGLVTPGMFIAAFARNFNPVFCYLDSLLLQNTDNINARA